MLYHKDIKINAVLKSFSKLLKKDGIVVITTPAIKILQNKIFLTVMTKQCIQETDIILMKFQKN